MEDNPYVKQVVGRGQSYSGFAHLNLEERHLGSSVRRGYVNSTISVLDALKRTDEIEDPLLKRAFAAVDEMDSKK